MSAAGMYKDGKRIDPYKTYKFVVKMDGRIVAGVSKVSQLKRTTEVITWNEGGMNDRDHKIPGRTSYEGITLERGITDDKEFEEWALKIHPFSDSERDIESFKKDLQLVVRDEKNKEVLRYNLFGCWVSEYTLPEFDASGNAIGIETIKIELDGWEREEI